MAGQALVLLNSFNDRTGRQNMQAPVVLSRNREDVRSVTLTIPLMESSRGRGMYLTVQLPQDEVDQLMERASALPEAQRRAFIRDWLRENQEAALSRYLEMRGGGSPTRRFTFETVPIPATPRPATRAAVPVRTGEEPLRPRAPAAAAEPVDIGGLVIRRREPPAVSATAGRDVPESRVTVRPAPRREEVPEQPREIRSGNGTRESPFVLRSSMVRRASRGTGSREIEVPLHLDVEGLGTVYFQLELTANQLNDANWAQTSADIQRIVGAVLRRRAADRHMREHETGIRQALNGIRPTMFRFRERLAERDARLGEYLFSH